MFGFGGLGFKVGFREDFHGYYDPALEGTIISFLWLSYCQRATAKGHLISSVVSHRIATLTQKVLRTLNPKP